jgi:Cys-rich protein (TIGR01571 family)
MSNITQQQHEQGIIGVRDWNTGLCECMRDEESCWWGFWCPCLLSGRNAAIYGLDNSLKLVLIFIGSIFAYMILMSMFLPGLALLILTGGMVYLLYKRILYRGSIRNTYNIIGDTCNDCLLHCCCSQCTICQEAREAKNIGLKNLDLCSGEDLYMYRDENHSPKGNNDFRYSRSVISKTSKIILYVNAVLAVLCIVSLLLLKKPLNIAVLLMVFIQPFLILYFIYWRNKKDTASLDYVIKLFAVGFWFSTFQAAILESILQFFILLAVMPFIGPIGAPLPTDDFGPPSGPPNDGSPPHGPPTMLVKQLISQLQEFISSSSCGPLLRHSISSTMGHIIQLFSFSEVASDGFNNYDYYSSSANSITMLSANNTTSSNSTIPDDTFKKEAMKSHIFIVIIVLFLMAFVVAAGCEECMKHFAVRCCAFPTSLKEPYEVLVYLVAAALGFSTAENIEYVFGTRASPIPGTSLFVGEILILLVRVLMPIHVICAVLQSINLSKVLMGAHSSLFFILLPALVLHGLFDFQLFLAGVIEYVYDLNSIALEIGSLVFSLLLAIGSGIYAYKSFRQVMNNFEQGFMVISSNDEEVMNAML